MKMLLTANKVRAIADAAATEKDLEILFRSHKIRFSWTTAPGFLAARVPVRSGSVLVYRTCSRSAPFRVRACLPDLQPLRPVPGPFRRSGFRSGFRSAGLHPLRRSRSRRPRSTPGILINGGIKQ